MRHLWKGLAPFLLPVVLFLSSSFGASNPLEEAERLNARAIRLYKAGWFAEALPLAQRSVAIYEKALGPNHPHVAAVLNNLAKLYWAQRRYAEAEPLYRRSLAIYENALGPEHPDVATVLDNLVTLYDEQGRPQEAEPLHRRALAIREKALSATSTEVGD